MFSNRFLEAVSTRLSAVSGDRWEVIELEKGGRIEVVWASAQRVALRATREEAPASEGDIQFIGHSRSDVELLLQCSPPHAPSLVEISFCKGYCT
jgi:hypothetical protein